MWTQAHRATYRQSGLALPSDLTDAQWQGLEPLIPAAKWGGRPRKTDMRAAMNAIFYLLRTGCPWRYLPRGPFPPRSTVYNIFRQFQRDGAWERIWEELHMALREALDREASPTAAIIDSQSLKAAEKGEAASRDEKDAVGYDAGKKVKGRKVHALVDVEGLPLRVIVHSAGIQDRDGAALVLDKIRKRFPWLELVWADAGYNAHQVKDAVARSPGLRLEIVKRTDDIKGFVVLPRRWVVERTFSWFGRNRRLAKDYENLAQSLTAFVTLAAIQFAIRRLARR
jgi:transposase